MTKIEKGQVGPDWILKNFYKSEVIKAMKIKWDKPKPITIQGETYSWNLFKREPMNMVVMYAIMMGLKENDFASITRKEYGHLNGKYQLIREYSILAEINNEEE